MVNRCEAAPIIIGCAPSTGSSLLRVALSRHPCLFSGGELAVLDKPGLFEESDASFRRNILGWLSAGYPCGFTGSGSQLFRHLSDYSWTESALRQMVRSCTSYPQMLSVFFDKPVRLSGTRRWVEKTPGNIFCFQRLHALFPDAMFVHITRDARDSVVSLTRRGMSPFRAVTRWYYGTLTGIQYRIWENYYEVKYEQLTQDPERELRKLCAFLREDYLDAMLEADGRKRPTLDGWNSDHYACINTNSVGQYKSLLGEVGRGMLREVRISRSGQRNLPFACSTTGIISPIELQRRLGYGVELLEDAPALSWAARRAAQREFATWRWNTLRTYHRWFACPTRF